MVSFQKMHYCNIFLVVVLIFGSGVVHAADPLTKDGFDVQAYGGPLYEPRYCDPSGHLPMSACVMANLNMAEDYLLRVISVKNSGASLALDADVIRRDASQSCDNVYAEAVKRYRSGDLIDIERWSYIRRAYHQAALKLLK